MVFTEVPGYLGSYIGSYFHKRYLLFGFGTYGMTDFL